MMESMCNMESACTERCECSECNECNECNTCNDCCENMTLNARILRVCCCQLLVCDLCSSQEFLVHTSDACCFRVGECVCITYNGAATMSIPPQISAICIRRMNNGGNNCGCCC